MPVKFININTIYKIVYYNLLSLNLSKKLLHLSVIHPIPR